MILIPIEKKRKEKKKTEKRRKRPPLRARGVEPGPSSKIFPKPHRFLLLQPVFGARRFATRKPQRLFTTLGFNTKQAIHANTIDDRRFFHADTGQVLDTICKIIVDQIVSVETLDREFLYGIHPARGIFNSSMIKVKEWLVILTFDGYSYFYEHEQRVI